MYVVLVYIACDQHCTSAVNMTLPALAVFSAERRAAAPLLLSAPAAVDRYLLPTGEQQQTRRRLLQRPIDGTDRRTDRRTPYRFIDPASRTMRVVSINGQ